MVEPVTQSKTMDQLELPRICLIGYTGVGKSTLSNLICGEEKFPTSGTFDACTSEVIQHQAKWEGKGDLIYVVDTYGFGGSSKEEIEEDQMNNFVARLKEFARVNQFILVLNGKQPRWDKSTLEMLKAFKNILGEKVLKHLVVVFTNWDHSSSAQRHRKKTGESEGLKEMELNKSLKERLEIDTGNYPVKCLFIDSVALMDLEYEDETALALHKKEFDKLREICFSAGPFLCMNLKAYESGKKLLKQVQDELEKIKKDKLLQEAALRKEREEKFLKFEKEHYLQRFQTQLKIQKKINEYFDYLPTFPEMLESFEKLQSSTLYKDVTKILKQFNELDRRNNNWLIQSRFERALVEEFNSKVPDVIEKRIKKILEEEFQSFAGNYPGLLGLQSADFERLLQINSMVDFAWGASAMTLAASVGMLALGAAEEGLIAASLVRFAASVVAGIALTGGLVLIIATPLVFIGTWSREKVINQVIPQAVRFYTSKINFRYQLQELAQKAFDIAADKVYSLQAENLRNGS